MSKSKPYVRVATRDDCFDLAARLRKEDRLEVSHTWGLSPIQSILLGFRTGVTFAVVWETEVVALFGCGGVPGVYGVPWMLASPTLSKIQKSFLRECREYVRMMLMIYGHLENWVWAGNEVHIKWLRWLGFTIEAPQPHGIHDQPFHRFYMRTMNV